jgi:hypothetical protein
VGANLGLSYWGCLRTGCYLTPWWWALLEKPPVLHPLKNFPTFYGTRRFITVFTRALHWSLSWARSIHPIPPHCISPRSILSNHVLVFLAVSFFLAITPIAYMHSSCHSIYMPCQSHPLWFGHSKYLVRSRKPRIRPRDPSRWPRGTL